MGYKRKRKIYKLTFTGDSELEGLEVMARSLSVGQMLELVKLADSAGMVDARAFGGPLAADPVGADSAEMSKEAVAAVEGMIGYFAKALMTWNLEDEDGKKIPATLKGLKDQDTDFVLKIIGEWMTAASGVSADLGKGSTSGPRFPEVSIPMDVR